MLFWERISDCCDSIGINESAIDIWDGTECWEINVASEDELSKSLEGDVMICVIFFIPTGRIVGGFEFELIPSLFMLLHLQ